MATLKDLAHGALKDLHVTEGQEDPEAEDSAVALAKLREVIARLPEYGGGRKLVDQSTALSLTAKPDARIICTVSGVTITLPADPADGTRVSVMPLTGTASVTSSDRQLEAATSTVTVSVLTTWTYRADQVDWVKVTTLGDVDDSPFGADSDSAIRYITALELADIVGADITPSLARNIAEAQSYLRSKYYRPREQDWTKSVPFSVQGPNRLRGYR